MCRTAWCSPAPGERRGAAGSPSCPFSTSASREVPSPIAREESAGEVIEGRWGPQRSGLRPPERPRPRRDPVDRRIGRTGRGQLRRRKRRGCCRNARTSNNSFRVAAACGASGAESWSAIAAASRGPTAAARLRQTVPIGSQARDLQLDVFNLLNSWTATGDIAGRRTRSPSNTSDRRREPRDSPSRCSGSSNRMQSRRSTRPSRRSSSSSAFVTASEFRAAPATDPSADPGEDGERLGLQIWTGLRPKIFMTS